MKHKLFKQQNTRTGNRKISESDEKGGLNLQMITAKIAQFYTEKPKLFIGSALGVTFSFILVMSLGGDDGDTNSTESSSLAARTIEPIIIDSTFDDADIVDAPRDTLPDTATIEEALLIPSIEDSIDFAEELVVVESTSVAEPVTPSIASTPRKIAKPVPAPFRANINTPKKVSNKSWVFNKKPKQYTIQLIGGANKDEIKKFIAKNKNVKRLSYFNTIKNGKNWYVVVQSTYESYNDAKNFRKTLPKHLRKNKPWIRSYASIQKEININLDKINLLNNAFAETD